MYRKVRDIVSDRIHGSTIITLNLLTFLSDALMHVETSRAIKILEEILKITKERRSIILPANLVYVLKKTIELSSTMEEKTDIAKITKLLLSSYDQEVKKAAENTVDVLRNYRKLFTLSYSSQVLRILERVPNVEVSITTGWPLLDGYKAFKEFRSRGVKARIYPDSSIYEAIFLSDAVILGCDAVLTDGSAVNRSGSKVAALICYKESIPLYIVCDSMKLDFQSIWSPEIWSYIFEEEMMDFQVFEKINSSYVSNYISNLGLHTPEDFVSKALRKIENYPYELIH